MKDVRVLFTAAPGVVMWPNGSVQVESSVPSVALYTLPAVVEAAGFPCTILDPVEYWRLRRETLQFRELVQEHSVFCISANSSTWPAARTLIQKAAAVEPRPVIVVGGLHATYCDEHVLKTTPADIVVRGEGELVLPELLRRLAAGTPLDDVCGLTLRRDGAVMRTPDSEPLSESDLCRAPLPLWDRLPYAVYGFLPVEVSRGCKYGCTFCSIYHKRLWRSVGESNVRERIHRAVEHLDRVRHRTLMFSDDCFTTEPEGVRCVAAILASVAPDVGIGVEARAGDVLKDATLDALAGMNIEFIQIGVECGYPEGIRKVKKGITIEQVVASTQALHRIGLHGQAKYSYIIGFPWEAPREMMRTMAFAMSLGARYGNHVQVNWHIVFPGSELYWEFKRAGKVSEDDYDALPPEDSEMFFRTHPTVDASTATAIDDYGTMLEQSYPWVAALGNVFRSWRRHCHLPIDRTAPAADDSGSPGCCAGPAATPAGRAGWWPVPPVLQADTLGGP